jgi:hypothetical protein
VRRGRDACAGCSWAIAYFRVIVASNFRADRRPLSSSSPAGRLPLGQAKAQLHLQGPHEASYCWLLILPHNRAQCATSQTSALHCQQCIFCQGSSSRGSRRLLISSARACSLNCCNIYELIADKRIRRSRSTGSTAKGSSDAAPTQFQGRAGSSLGVGGALYTHPYPAGGGVTTYQLDRREQEAREGTARSLLSTAIERDTHVQCLLLFGNWAAQRRAAAVRVQAKSTPDHQ